MAFSESDAMRGLHAPSEEEQEFYYTGLGGRPHLVARTSTTVWQRHVNMFSTRKTVATVGNHPLVQAWCSELRNGIVAILNDSNNDDGKGLEWNTFYPIRMGDPGDYQTRQHAYPVVLLVGLLPNDTCTWDAAIRIALRCRALLQAHNIWDVEVELTRQQVVPLASSATAELASSMDWTYSKQVTDIGLGSDTYGTGINAELLPLLQFPGRRIEQEEAVAGEAEAQAGTLGVYIRLQHASESTKPSTLYGLTNRHVAIGRRVAIDQDIVPAMVDEHSVEENNSQSLQVLSGGSSCRYAVVGGLLVAEGILRDAFRVTQMSHAKNTDSLYWEKLNNLQASCLTYIEALKDKLHALETMTSSQRVVGTVVYSPRYERGRQGHFKDWALIKITERDVIPRNESEINQVYVSRAAAVLALNKVQARETTVLEDARDESRSLGWRIESQIPELDANGFLRLHGQNLPAQPPFDNNQRISLLVGKRGQKSGLTFGLTNEIEAVQRTPFTADMGGPVVSRHLLVVGHDQAEAFSDKGDSGSCVFDCTGRVVGMVDAGTNKARRNSSRGTERDVTFVTPIQWILDDIREFTGCEPGIV